MAGATLNELADDTGGCSWTSVRPDGLDVMTNPEDTGTTVAECFLHIDALTSSLAADEQFLHVVCPVWFWYLPGGQILQTAEELRWCVPGLHGVTHALDPTCAA